MPFIMITVLIDMVSIGLIMPVLPALVGSFTGVADRAGLVVRRRRRSPSASPTSSPRRSSARCPTASAAGRCCWSASARSSLSFFVTALATALWMLIVVRLFSGAMQSNASVANAYVADITPPEDRAKRFGLLGAMFGIGFILGPVMGGLLGAIDLRLPFFAAGSLALLNLLYGWFVLPESLPRRAGAGRSPGARRSIRSPRSTELGRLGGVGLLVAVVACTALSQFVLYTSWVLYTTFKFGWGPQENGWSLFTVGCMSALVQGVLLGRLLKRFSPQRLAIVGLVSSTLAYLALGRGDRGLDDVRGDPRATSSASPSRRRSRASSRAPPTRRRRAERWARSARCRA